MLSAIFLSDIAHKVWSCYIETKHVILNRATCFSSPRLVYGGCTDTYEEFVHCSLFDEHPKEDHVLMAEHEIVYDHTQKIVKAVGIAQSQPLWWNRTRGGRYVCADRLIYKKESET